MKCWYLWVIGLLVAIGGAFIIIGIVSHHFDPGWAEESGTFLHLVGDALQKYSLEHGGKLPPTLASLYPEYMNDKRVLEQTPSFRKRMAIIYWHPPRLGSAHTPVAQLVLDPSVKTDYPWRGRVLWGDGRVRLYKM